MIAGKAESVAQPITAKTAIKLQAPEPVAQPEPAELAALRAELETVRAERDQLAAECKQLLKRLDAEHVKDLEDQLAECRAKLDELRGGGK